VKRRVYFCGLARNCDQTVGLELAHLLEMQRSSKQFEISIIVAENDSKDATRSVIRSTLKSTTGGPLNRSESFDELDSTYPLRVHRLAFLRETLKNIAQEDDSKKPSVGSAAIYVPIDLDGDFARSLSLASIEQAIRYLEDEHVDACFPVSGPVYYDIYALRAEGWVDFDSVVQVERRVTPLGRLLATYWFVSRNQRRLTPDGLSRPLQVESAFGGFGIYRLDAVGRASYLAGAKVRCEHVTLNRQIGEKRIFPPLCVNAPSEHVGLATSTKGRIAKLMMRALLTTARQFGPRFPRWAANRSWSYLRTRARSIRKWTTRRFRSG